MNLSSLINFSLLANLQTFNYLGFINDDITFHLIFVAILPFIFLLISAIVLWVFAFKLSKHLTLDSESNNVEVGSINLNELQTIAFSIIGVVILSSAIPQIFRTIPNLIELNEISSALATPQFRTELIFSLSEKVFRIIIGLILLFGSKGLIGLLNRIREAGAK